MITVIYRFMDTNKIEQFTYAQHKEAEKLINTLAWHRISHRAIYA